MSMANEPGMVEAERYRGQTRAELTGRRWTAMMAPGQKVLDAGVALLRPLAHRSIGALAYDAKTAWWVPLFRLIPSFPSLLRWRTNPPLAAWPTFTAEVPR